MFSRKSLAIFSSPQSCAGETRECWRTCPAHFHWRPPASLSFYRAPLFPSAQLSRGSLYVPADFAGIAEPEPGLLSLLHFLLGQFLHLLLSHGHLGQVIGIHLLVLQGFLRKLFQIVSQFLEIIGNISLSVPDDRFVYR